MVSTYMMNLFKLARDNGIFCQYDDSEVTKDAERRSGATSQGKTAKFGSTDDSEKSSLLLVDEPDEPASNK